VKQQLKKHPFYIYLIFFRGMSAAGVLFFVWDRSPLEILISIMALLISFVLSQGVYAGIVYSAIAEEKRRKQKAAAREKLDREMKKKKDFVSAQNTSTEKYIRVTSYKDAAGQKAPLKGGKPAEEVEPTLT
jgi:hypothetical protein